MKGNIYTSQKCFLCGGKLIHDENRQGCFCRLHSQVAATEGFMVRFGRDITKRFRDYKPASQFLTGLRFKTIEGTFDQRDYKRDNPLGFENQARKWLAIKAKTVSRNQYREIERYMRYAIGAWGERNVKTIRYPAIEDFLFGFDKISEKTRANIRSALNDFWQWLADRESIPLPRIPKIGFELGWRNIIDLETQAGLIEEVKRISFAHNPRIWLGIKWLATYVAMRPNELRTLRERDIDVSGFFVIPKPKEKKPKLVAMLPEDIALYESMTPRGLPDMPFFRHIKGNGSAKPGSLFGKDYLYKWWKKACANLNVEGVDLYGGTRHSTTTALSDFFSREELREAGTMHATNQAFERYYQAHKDNSIKIYQTIQTARDGKLVRLKKKTK